MFTILTLSGSLRRDSWNTAVAALAGEGARSDDVNVIDLHLADFPLPMFNQDTEATDGTAPELAALRAHFRSAHGLLLGVPEYNGGPTGALKNAIDWLSRPVEGHDRLDCFGYKVCGLLSASPGPLGGIRGLPITRTILSGIGMHVLPQQMAVGNVVDAMQDDARRDQIRGIGAAVADAVRRLHG